MKLEIRRVSVDKECLFNTLRLALVVDHKQIEFDTIGFREGVE